ncbi:MAG: ExbD/TolR family protein [Thermogutta sp.]
MKFRGSGTRTGGKIELMMTPMIDVVFQLLTFFIMTFKIVSPEGDFFIKMPLAAPSAGVPSDAQLPPIKVRLTAAAGGRLSGIYLSERRLGGFEELRQQVRLLVGDQAGPGGAGDAEVEFDCDYDLNYENVMKAVTAVSGYVAPDGRIIRLVEKIKFAPPRKE